MYIVLGQEMNASVSVLGLLLIQSGEEINTPVSSNAATPLLDTYPRERKTYVHTKTYTRMFTVALCITTAMETTQISTN